MFHFKAIPLFFQTSHFDWFVCVIFNSFYTEIIPSDNLQITKIIKKNKNKNKLMNKYDTNFSKCSGFYALLIRFLNISIITNSQYHKSIFVWIKFSICILFFIHLTSKLRLPERVTFFKYVQVFWIIQLLFLARFCSPSDYSPFRVDDR